MSELNDAAGTIRGRLRASGTTHVGRVRTSNEDRMLVEPEVGLYAVFDGMGGHSAGDVAAQLARDVLLDYVRTRERGGVPARILMEAGLQTASGAIHSDALSRRDRRGMGTTAVACFVPRGETPVIAHVGDSRAYLLREGRLMALTRDHTVVADLVEAGQVSPEDAIHHPYKSMLSRNLGARPKTKVDLLDLDLFDGDRVMLCSDGLTGFAPIEAIHQVLVDAEDADHAANELVQLALRCGGGDNVTSVVVEVGTHEPPPTTLILRSSGADAWWSRRDRFLDAARRRGVAESAVCAVLSPEEAIEIVAGNLCEAIHRDMKESTAAHVWAYAENLASGWLDQDGSYEVLADLIERLRGAAEVALADLHAEGAPHATAVDLEVYRALTNIQVAVGSQLAERWRAVEEAVVSAEDQRREPSFLDQPTIPFTGVRVEPPSPEVARCLEQAGEVARRRLPDSDADLDPRQWIECAHGIACDQSREGDAGLTARALYGSRGTAESEVGPVLDSLDRARQAHISAIRESGPDLEVRAAAMRRVVAAHQALASAVAGLVIEAGQPTRDELAGLAESTAALRAQVRRDEGRLIALERAAQALAVAPDGQVEG